MVNRLNFKPAQCNCENWALPFSHQPTSLKHLDLFHWISILFSYFISVSCVFQQRGIVMLISSVDWFCFRAAEMFVLKSTGSPSGFNHWDSLPPPGEGTESLSFGKTHRWESLLQSWRWWAEDPRSRAWRGRPRSSRSMFRSLCPWPPPVDHDIFG